MALYTVRSERMFREQLDYNLLSLAARRGRPLLRRADVADRP